MVRFGQFMGQNSEPKHLLLVDPKHTVPAELTDATGTSVLSSRVGSVRATADAVSSMMLSITSTVCSWSKVPNAF